MQTIPTSDLDGAVRFYETARTYIKGALLSAELDWQRSTEPSSFTEQDLLREAAWVILCSGFREATVRAHFDYISLCYCDWESAEAIVESAVMCREAAGSVFNHAAKLHAICQVAEIVQGDGFDCIKQRLLLDPIPQLRRFAFIGPVTAWHLAKNLGFDVAKPDRHLMKISKAFNFPSPAHLCEALANVTGESVKVVDIALWRYFADRSPSLSQLVLWP